MARRSTSSSAPPANGHSKASTSTDKARSARQDSDEDSEDFVARYEAKTKPLPFDSSLLPPGERSLASIGFQAFFLGFTLAGCTISTTWLLLNNITLWRLPAFFACLSFFHFLEYWCTARFNAPATRSESFLLFNNGMAYNVAHTLAAFETIISYLFPSYQSFFVNYYTTALGVLLIVLGQAVRSVAMAQAATNFNHTPQRTRKDGHELVTTGVYAWLRHPSYFGFFWWALGTQLMVGNKICFVGYLCVLWSFFKHRIRSEERWLVDFFGREYEVFRKRTGTGIPLIR